VAQPHESSVLFSLAELRQIEQERIEAEEADRAAAIEAEKRAQLEAERLEQIRIADAARREAEREREAAEQAEAERRQEALRIEQAERQARIAADAEIAQKRLAEEMQLRRIEAENRRPVGLKLLAAALVAIALALGVVVYQKAQEAERRAGELAETRAEIGEIQTRLQGLVADKQRAYEAKLAAKTEDDEKAAAEKIAAIDREIAERNAALERLENRRTGRRTTRTTSTSSGTSGTSGTSGDVIKLPDCDGPLCGLGEP